MALLKWNIHYTKNWSKANIEAAHELHHCEQAKNTAFE